MPYYPVLKETKTKRIVTDEFSGYNHNLKIGDGEFFNTQNLSTALHPVFTNRKKRGLLRELTEPGGLLAKEKLAWADNGKLYYDGMEVLSGLTPGRKQIVSFGAYIVVFPDKVYYNTKEPDDQGTMETFLPAERLDQSAAGTGYAINFTVKEPLNCDFYPYYELPAENDEYYYAWAGISLTAGTPDVNDLIHEFHAGDQILFPEEYTNYEYPWNHEAGLNPEWFRRNPATIVKMRPLDYPGEIPVRIVEASPATGEGVYNAEINQWQPRQAIWYTATSGVREYHLPLPYNRDMTAKIIPATVTRVEVNGTRMLSGWAYNPQTGIVNFNTAPAVAEKNNVRITYVIDTGGYGADFLVAVPKKTERLPYSCSTLQTLNVPETDFVIECKNRLWGCRYGTNGDEVLNEIYGSALGNFKKWRQYEGLASDSWAASVGSDGPWTGAINYMGYPTFFKEDRIHRVAVSANGAHEITETVCEGVQKESDRSLAVINGLLYYKGPNNVCIYQGGLTPSFISEKLGQLKYSDASAGAFDGYYYLSMKNESNGYDTFVFDTEHGLWIREDDAHFTDFAQVGEELYGLMEDGKLCSLQAQAGTLESAVEWFAESGVMYYEYPDKKYIGRFDIRLEMEEGSRVRIYLEFNSSGKWLKAGEIIAGRLRTVTLPVRPRRCDHLRMKIEGSGNVRIWSIARILESGSDY